MSVFIRICIGALFFAYPFIIYYGLMNFALWQMALFVTALAGLRAFVFKNQASKMARTGFYGSLMLVVFSLLSFVLNQNGWLKLYPILMNLLFFAVFFHSLFTPKSIIQNLAELKEKNTTEKQQKYMRKLTQVWCVFFIINAAISTYTLAYLSMTHWVVYNGLISYILIGSLVVFELLYRHLFVIKRTV